MRVVCVPAIANCPQPSQFSVQVTNNGVQGTPFQGAPQTTVTLAPGNYDANLIAPFPPNPSGTSRTIDRSGCSDQINAGDIFRCDITVTYFPPSTLTVSKQVQCPPNFTCPLPSNFIIRVNGTGAFPNSFQGSSAGTNVTLGPGPFRVTEVQNPNPPGLVRVTDASACNGVITGTNQVRQCTIINRYLEDTDGDGLPNTWETNGIDINNDGVIDYRIPNANPNHKNLYVELDYMTGHRPVGGNNGLAVGGSAMQDVGLPSHEHR
jgi:hypothetical protein